ncbi:MAG TPA: bifunctional UDP-sugar hydrolase/5'-nucleotidase [Polyangiaceae bacterium]|nr:bifunctional UDP-sugar hydrolase/5'-nucleotidase [Polyangiaceae bacterium]
MALFAVALAGCTKAPPERGLLPPIPPVSAPLADSSEFTLSLLSLNDLHGRLGALPAFAGYVSALRRARGDAGAVAVVDAGDMFQGTLASNGSEGSSVIAAYNALGVRASVLGNHEFDYGPLNGVSGGEGASAQGALRARIAEAKFPVLAANLVDLATGALPTWNNLSRDALLDVSGVRVGFVGAMTRQTPGIVMPDYFQGLDVSALAPAVEASARSLRERGAEAVVVLAHAGADCGRADDPHDLSTCDADTAEVFALARALPAGLVDAIVAGHTHAVAAHYVNGIPIVEALSRGKAFGRIDLHLGGNPRRVQSARPFPPEPLCPDSGELASCPLHSYAGQVVEADAALGSLVERELQRARSARQQLVGAECARAVAAAGDEESPLGNLFADAMRAHVPGADVALTNGGGLRADLPSGPLSYGALYEAMPFDNRLVKIQLTAAELIRVLSVHVSHDEHGLVSVSGVRVKASCQGGALSMRLMRSDGRTIADNARLTLVTSDYLATGGDRLFAPIELARSRIEPLGDVLMRDALAAEFNRRGRIDPRDKRLFDPAQPRIELPSKRPVTCPRP